MEGKIEEAEGFKWFVRPDTMDFLGPSQHEELLWSRFFKLFDAGTTFVDVGAHVGRYSLRLAPWASAVIAIEPNPYTLPVLLRNIELNELEDRISVFPFAAWDKVEKLTISDRGGSSKIGEEGVEVHGFPLDDLLANHNDRISFMKIDVEGAEGAALRGMHETLILHKPDIFLELHDRIYGDMVRYESHHALTQAGYDWRQVASWGACNYYHCFPLEPYKEGK